MRHTSIVARGARRERGLSLIELMIAMTLGLLTIAGIGYVYLGSAQAYKTQDATSRLQESARYAFELIGKDLRMAGSIGGCSNFAANPPRKALNTLAWYGNLFNQPLASLEWDGAAGPTEYSDALRILRADTSNEYIVKSHDSGTAEFTLAAASDLAEGQLMIANDCKNVALFQASSVTSNSGVTNNTISHAAAAGSPGNSNIDLSAAGTYTYLEGSRLYRLQAVTYFVKRNPAGVPALYRITPQIPNATLSSEEELIEGVEDFQITYGVDTSNAALPDGEPDFLDPDGDGDPYLTAAQILTSVPGATTDERWQRIASVRVSLLMRTVENNVTPKAQTYKYNGGAAVNATDRYIRKVFTHVVELRNR